MYPTGQSASWRSIVWDCGGPRRERSAQRAGSRSMSSATSIRADADVVKVVQVSDISASLGERCPAPVYPEDEIGSCPGLPPMPTARFAALLEAKKAPFKVFRPSGHAPALAIGGGSAPLQRWCSTSLPGDGTDLATRARTGELAVRLTDQEGVARLRSSYFAVTKEFRANQGECTSMSWRRTEWG
jgi:hypothetical protein